ncbi:MAG TPA: DUF1844 domain-containing protein [Pyrinomonadaceae bacterium]|jgi:hypothetical protein|nr:DUF1844 domain-containing protein [Pyrinomonadaceae bacterium]
MSEEKPTFKITDRRLFNADGSPREEIREEPEPAPQPQAPESGTTLADVADARPAEPAPKGATREAVEEAAKAEGVRAEPAAPRRAERERESRESQADAGASEEFLMLVEFLASFAADALGMVNHPGGGGGVNLQLAKQCIDMLGTLKSKTSGNLSDEESQFLDMILSQLRMQYVSLANAPRPPQGGRGFSGGDITGGR